jgi:endonuclease YncB( thermonuclease family)
VALLTSACVVQVARTSTTAPRGSVEVEVIRVIDGDSVEFRLESGQIEARLLGVNATELFDDSDELTCNGGFAKSALEQTLRSGKVTLVRSGLDRFGRVLVEVLVDGVSVQETMIAAGWVLATGEDRDRRESMAEAADSNQGMFGATCGFAETDQLLISGVQADAPGNDRFNLAEEWVELHNSSDATLDLTGWVLRDETTGHRFALEGSVLAPGANLKVRSGTRSESGSYSDTDVFLDESFPVWSNAQETVLLIDPKGVVAQVKFLIGVGE